MDNFRSTILPQDNSVDENKKAIIDLLKKINKSIDNSNSLLASIKSIQDFLSQNINQAVKTTSSPSFVSLSLSGFTSLGELSTGIKMKVFSGTTPAAPNSKVSIAHGLSGKIICAFFSVDNSGVGTNGIPPDLNNWLAGFNYSAWWDGTNLELALSIANSVNILSRPYRVVVFYTA